VKSDRERPTVTLLEPGQQPRRDLRLKLTVGTEQVVELRTKLKLSSRLDGASLPQTELPTMIATIETIVTKGTPSSATVEWRILQYTAESSPKVQAAVLDAVRSSLYEMVGVIGELEINDQGVTTRSSVDPLPGSGPDVVSMVDDAQEGLANLSFALPTEPIGLGGSWRVSQPISVEGVRSDADYVLTVTALDDERVETTIRLASDAEPGVISNPKLPSGVSMNLESMKGTGAGSNTIMFNRAFPTTYKMKSKTKLKATLTAEDNVPHSMTSDVGLVIEAGNAPES